MYSFALLALSVVPFCVAQTGTLTATLSGVLPVLPTPFNGVRTNQGAIVAADKLPFQSVTPVNGLAMTQTQAVAATYVATLPMMPFNGMAGNIQGTIKASATQGQVGVTFDISLSGFTNLTYGTFPYHIHELRVPADGNCVSTTSHFDNTNAGELYLVNTTVPMTFIQTGDLASKHGRIPNTTSTYTTSYVDDFVSLDPMSAYFIGNRSIVIHSNNSTRLTCANFMMEGSNSTVSSTTRSATGTAVVTSMMSSMASMATGTATTTRPASFTGAADRVVAGAGAVVAALGGLMML